jgi:hypothetical protein
MTAPDKNNYFKQIVDHFLLSINAGNELLKLTSDELKLGKIQNALNSIRQCTEAIVNYIILENILSPNNPIPIINKQLWEKIQYLHDYSYFDNNANVVTRNQNNGIKLLEFTKLRFGGNNGSHTSSNINSNPDLNDYFDCKILLKQITKWFFNLYSLNYPINVQTALDSDLINPVDLPHYDDWFYFASQYENFKARNTQYVLITSANLKNRYSLPQMQSFIKSDIDWHLIIDFDETSQSTDNGLCKLINNEYGLENIRVYSPSIDETKIDFTTSPTKSLTFFYLAQDSVSVSNIKQWNKVNGKKLEIIFEKSRAKSIHSNLVVICILEELEFLDSVFDILNRAYGSETNKISLAIISFQSIVNDDLQHGLKDFEGIFNSFKYFLFNSNDLIDGFSKNKKNIVLNDSNVIIPAYTTEQEDTQINLEYHIYEEFLTTKFMEVIHREIGKSNPNEDDFEKISAFYRGDEITWRGIAYRNGAGIDIQRSQMDTIENDIRSLLKTIRRFYKFELYHEPSAGGTTVAKRMAYLIGTDDYPTIIIHKFHKIETFKGIEQLYRISGNKPILAIIEEAQVGYQEMEEFENQFKNKHIRLVAVYVKRVIRPTGDIKLKSRTLNSILDDKEIAEFEDVFCQIMPNKKHEIKEVKNRYKSNKDFITPFIYGLTTYETEFLGLESYVEEVLKRISNDKVKQTVGFISLIGKYTNIPIKEIFFIDILGLANRLKNDDAVFKLLRKSTLDPDAWEIRHILVANEVCEQILCGGDLSKKSTWRSALKNWLFDLIELFNKLNPDGLIKDSLDKEIIEAIFINKSISTDIEENEKFSKLITELNENQNEGLSLSREVLKKLCDVFPKHAFFYQHLSRLYLHSARFEDPIYFDLAITTAQKAIDYEPNTNTVYHTKGDAITRKINFIHKEFNKLIKTEDKSELEQELVSMFEDAEYCLNKCIDLDIDSPYGYSSFIYLITYTIDLGRKLSEHNSLNSFLEDQKYEWFTEKIQLALDLIERLLEIYRNSGSNKEYEIEKTQNNYIFLTRFLQRSYSFYDKQERSCKSDNLKLFYRNAYIVSLLQKYDFANPQKAWNQLNKEQIKEIVIKLKANLRFRPALHDLRRYFNALRTKKTNLSLSESINFLEEIFNKEVSQGEIKDKFFISELAYYLFVLCSIQDINNDDTIDTNYFNKAEKYLEVSQKNNKIVKNDTFEFEWLGKNTFGGLEQMVNRKELGEFKTNEFTNDITKLHEITGRIISVGDLVNDRSSERKKGEIEFNLRSTGQRFIAYFIPIKGGLIEGQDQPCRFDDRKYENNQEVKFYLGFSYSGFRAWQPIPINSNRASLKEIVQKIEIPKQSITLSTESIYEFRVQTINNLTRNIEGKIRGITDTVLIPFGENKNYNDYKHLRRALIDVRYSINGFSMIDK